MAAFPHCSFLLSAFDNQSLINSTPHQLPPPIHQQPICTPHSNQASRMTNLNDCNEHSLTKTGHSPANTSMAAPVKLGDDGDVAQKKTKKRADYRNGSSKEGTEGRNKKQKKNNSNNGVVKKEKKPKIPPEPPTGYIHVRARRGEATDSHSLAERVRREKISERMRMLQRLVPGCDKITGKALVLDEIINYVHSLQNQVEFLSMKLASVNPTMFGDYFTMGQDTPMGTPDRLNSVVASPLPSSVPQCSTYQATNFADDYSATVFLQGTTSDVFSSQLDVLGELWDAEDQRQNFLHPCGFSTNLWSFQC